MSRLPIHGVLSCVSLLAFTATGTAADPAPAPRPFYQRFDLEYLPRLGGQGVIGIRPCEIAKHATKAEVEGASVLVFGVVSQLLGGKSSEEAAWPTFANLEQCVCSLQLHIAAPSGADERGSFILGGKSPGLLRTVRPFDWAHLLRKSLTNVSPARHAGRDYFRLPGASPLPLPFFVLLCEPMAAFIPDNRTMILGPESDIRAVLDRLAANKPAPPELPGWNEVDRSLIAIWFDNRTEPLVSGRFADDYPMGKEAVSLARSIETLAVGLSTSEDRTTVRLVLTAKGESEVVVAADALKSLFRHVAAKAMEEKETSALAGFIASLLKDIRIQRDKQTATATLSADGNLVKLIFSLFGDWL